MKKTTKPAREERDIWDRNDVAEHFRCSLPHVLKLVRAQGLPMLQLGNLVRFRRSDVLAWEQAQVKTSSKGAA
jgi:excisionase family DNA binding protein